jgi:hypothetical protein
MFPCPHCGKGIETGPPPNVPWHKYDPGGTRVSLGCGTLILIAIIVAMFSGTGDESDAIRDLQKEIQTLEEKIDNIELKAEVAEKAGPGENNP